MSYSFKPPRTAELARRYQQRRRSTISDGPLPVPPSVRDALPPFHTFGAHNCGQHGSPQAHAADDDDDDDDVRHPRLATPPLRCLQCGARESRGAMHLVACGHALCRPCMQDRVLGADFVVRHNEAEMSRRVYVLHIMRTYARQAWGWAPHADLEDLPSELEFDAEELASSLLGAAGLLCTHVEAASGDSEDQHADGQDGITRRGSEGGTRREAIERAAAADRCGQPLKLHRYMSCMDELVAKRCLGVTTYLRMPNAWHMWCGWPDCRALMAEPAACQFVSEGLDKYWCFVCGGNSREQRVDLNVRRDEYLCPAR